MMNTCTIRRVLYAVLMATTVLWAAGCKKSEEKKDIVNHPALALPVGAVIVANVNITFDEEDLAKMKQQMAMVGMNMDIDKLQEDLGLDITRDIKSIAVGIYEYDEKGATAGGVLIGNIDKEKITAFAEREVQALGGEVEMQTAMDVEYITALGLREIPLHIGFYSPEITLISNNETLLKNMIGVLKGKGENVASDDALNDLMEEVDSSRMLWAVGTIPEPKNPEKPAENQIPGEVAQVKKVETFSASMDNTPGFSLDVAMHCTSVEDAKTVQEEISKQVNMMVMVYGMMTGMADLAEKVNVETDEETVKLAVALSAEDMETFQQKMEEAAQKQMSASPMGEMPAPVQTP